MVKTLSAREVIFRAFADGFRPDPRLSVSEWADRHRRLTSEFAKEPGQWRTPRTPYLREIMDCFAPTSDVESLALMKGSQIGATEAFINCVGFAITQVPGPILYVMPSDELADTVARIRIDALIRDSDQVRERMVSVDRAKDKADTLRMKQFRGGVLRMISANSSKGMRSMPARFVICDEVDEYPASVKGQGDPLALVKRRTAAFANRKLLYASTPTHEKSRILQLFLEGDQRKYFVPCPHCGEFQPIEWKSADGTRRIVWEEGRPETARLLCMKCGALIDEHHKETMLPAGEWRATAEATKPRMRSYHLSALYSPFGMYSWREAVEDFLEAQRQGQESLKTWVNHILGEVWRERGDAPDWQRLFERREHYRIGTVPRRGLVLTAGVDVQKDRIEMEVVAWGRGLESWSVDYHTIPGDIFTDAPWLELFRRIELPHRHESGVDLHITAAGFDSGAFTSEVYKWVRRLAGKAFALKGEDGFRPIFQHARAVDVKTDGKRIARGLKLHIVGSDTVKQQLYGWLRLPAPTEPDQPFPAGYCHFPEHGAEWFKQLTAESARPRVSRGSGPKWVWEKTNHDRNEALDCRVYARAVLSIVGGDRMDEQAWDRIENSLGRGPARPTPRPRAQERRETGGDYIDRDRWRL